MGVCLGRFRDARRLDVEREQADLLPAIASTTAVCFGSGGANPGRKLTLDEAVALTLDETAERALDEAD
jgi:hypothetical protein